MVMINEVYKFKCFLIFSSSTNPLYISTSDNMTAPGAHTLQGYCAMHIPIFLPKESLENVSIISRQPLYININMIESIFFSITLTLIHIGGPMQRVEGSRWSCNPPPHYIKFKKKCNETRQKKKGGGGKKKKDQECKLHSFLIMF